MGISVKKMVEMSTEPFANNGTSLCTARLHGWLSLQTLHLQLPTQNCHFVQKMSTPLSTEVIPLFLDALPRLKNTPLPGERKGSREDHPLRPALYQWNSKCPKLHFPAVDLRVPTTLCPKRKNTFLYCPSLFTIFSCKLLFWDSSSAQGSPECSTFILQRAPEGRFQCHGTEQFLHCCFSLAPELWSGAVEDVWPRASPPWLLNALPLLSHYNGSSMDISCGLSCLQGPKLRQTQKKKKNSNCPAVQNMQYEEGWLGSALVYANYICAL